MPEITMSAFTFMVTLWLAANSGSLLVPVIGKNWTSLRTGLSVSAIGHWLVALTAYFWAGQQITTAILLLIIFGTMEALIWLSLHEYDREHVSHN